MFIVKFGFLEFKRFRDGLYSKVHVDLTRSHSQFNVQVITDTYTH